MWLLAILILGGLLLLLAGLSFLAQKTFFGISSLIFELFGLALISFHAGFVYNISMLAGIMFMLIIFLLATVFDPYIWRKITKTAPKDGTKKSFVINGTLGSIAIASFSVGSLIT